MREITLEREKVANYIRINPEILQGREGMDYVTDTLTIGIIGYVYSAAKEKGEVVGYSKRPTFMDWLLRRKLPVTVPYEISHLANIKDLPIDTKPIIRIPILEE